MSESGYVERPSTVPGAVLWQSTASGVSEILPDGCMDLIWTDGALLVAGPDEVPFHAAGASSRHVGLRLPPGLAPQLLGIPASALVNQRVALGQLGPRGATTSRIQAAAHDDPAVWLERVGTDLLAALEPRLRTAADQARTVAGWLDDGTSVAEVAHRLGLDVRQVLRLSRDWFGYGPKTLARILRLQRALEAASRVKTGADVAAVAGYTDQSHLNRDARKIAGRPFGELAGDR